MPVAFDGDDRILVADTKLQPFPYIKSKLHRWSQIVLEKTHVRRVGDEVSGIVCNRIVRLTHQPAIHQPYPNAQTTVWVMEEKGERDVDIMKVETDVIVVLRVMPIVIDTATRIVRLNSKTPPVVVVEVGNSTYPTRQTQCLKPFSSSPSTCEVMAPPKPYAWMRCACNGVTANISDNSSITSVCFIKLK